MLSGSPRALWAVFAALFWAAGFYGIADLLALVGARSGMDAVVGLEASWGVLFTLIVGCSFVSIAARPRDPWPAVVQLWTVAAALLLAAAIAASVDPLVVALILVPMTAATFVGARPVRARRRLQTDGPLFLLALAGAPAWWAYAAGAAAHAQAAGAADDFSWGLAHWPMQAALGIFMALIVLVMAFWPPGRRLHGTICCASSVVLAAGWLLYPDSSGSVDSTVMSVLAVLWGAAVFVCRIRGTGPGQAHAGPTGAGGPAPTNLKASPPRARPVRTGSARAAGREPPGVPWPDTEVLWPATGGIAAWRCLAFAVAAVQAALALAGDLGTVADQEA